MSSELYPFDMPQYLQLKAAVLEHKKILFTGVHGAGKTYAMYRLVSLLKDEISEDFKIFEFHPEAEIFSLSSTVISQFGVSGLPALLGDSQGSVRVFGDCIPMYTYPILALCKEPEALITSLACRYPEDAKTALRVNVGEKFESMVDNSFDLIVHVKRTSYTDRFAAKPCVSVTIYSA